MQETYIWKKKAWPRFTWDKTQINEDASVSLA